MSLTQDEIAIVGKKAADKVNLHINEKGLEILSSYARNGREAVNMIQLSAGLAITEERDYIKEDDIQWVVHSSQLTPRMERKINPESAIGLVNGLAVHGPNTGALLEIEVTVIPAKIKGSVNITGIVEEESIGDRSKSIRRKSMAKGSVENVITVLRAMGVPAMNMISMLTSLAECRLTDRQPGLRWQQGFTQLFISFLSTIK